MEKLQEIEFIQENLSQICERLYNLSFDSDKEIRFLVVETLKEFISDIEASKRLEEMIFDDDELVRISCVEALNDKADLDIEEILLRCLTDDSSIVKGEAAIALVKLRSESGIEIIRERCKLENLVESEQIRYLAALSLLPDSETFEKLVIFLKSSDYISVCYVANFLNRYKYQFNKKLLLSNLTEARRCNKTRAADSSIRNAIDSIKKMVLRRSV